jgi:hypothetical protein
MDLIRRLWKATIFPLIPVNAVMSGPFSRRYVRSAALPRRLIVARATATISVVVLTSVIDLSIASGVVVPKALSGLCFCDHHPSSVELKQQ